MVNILHYFIATKAVGRLFQITQNQTFLIYSMCATIKLVVMYYCLLLRLNILLDFIKVIFDSQYYIN